MSNTISTIIYEHPLNEKMRSWLRMECLLQQLIDLKNINSLASGLAFFRAVSELIEVLDRSDIRADIIKELDKQKNKLNQWCSDPHADKTLIKNLLKELQENLTSLREAPRIGQHLRQDKVISIARQRLSIPGGCCSFDLPALHLWLNTPKKEIEIRINFWIDGILPLRSALNMLLNLIRKSNTFTSQKSYNGFYQGSVENADLIRIKLPINLSLYPQISGHKTRFAIRFLHEDSENGIVPDELPFKLACC